MCSDGEVQWWEGWQMRMEKSLAISIGIILNCALDNNDKKAFLKRATTTTVEKTQRNKCTHTSTVDAVDFFFIWIRFCYCDICCSWYGGIDGYVYYRDGCLVGQACSDFTGKQFHSTQNWSEGLTHLLIFSYIHNRLVLKTKVRFHHSGVWVN